jgi:hypothetical protein
VGVEEGTGSPDMRCQLEERLPVALAFRLKPRAQCRRTHPQDGTDRYTDYMNYNVGSRVRVRLSSGKVVEAEIIAITNQSTGRKLQIVYDNVTASINPSQVTEVLSAT